MSTRNWRQYNKTLVQRGSLTFIIDAEMMKNLVPKANKKKIGRPLEFSDMLIEVLLMVKIHFKLPYRMLEGFSKCFFEKRKGVKVPNYSLVCKRAKWLSKKLPKLSSCKSNTIVVDATGIKVFGEGEWKVKKHGKGRRRKWLKIHVAIDEQSQAIVGELLPDALTDDGKAFPRLFNQISGSVKTVIGDGAYDDRDIRELIRKKGGKAIIPPPSNAICHGADLDRNRDILTIRSLGGGKIAKSIWSKLSGYSRISLVETTFSRYKKMFGERAFSKTRERLIVENRLKCVLLNKMIGYSA